MQVLSLFTALHRDDRALTMHSPIAFEFSKRKFQKTYGTDLPVWALLASGSTGGVGSVMILIDLVRLTPHLPLDFLLAGMLPAGRGEVEDSTSRNATDRNASAIHRC